MNLYRFKTSKYSVSFFTHIGITDFPQLLMSLKSHDHFCWYFIRENKTTHHLWMVMILENIVNKRSNIKGQRVRGLKERLGRKYPGSGEKHGFVSKKMSFIT